MSSQIFGTVVGGVIASGTQLLVGLRESRREQRLDRAQAQGVWRALQIQTIAELQDDLVAVAAGTRLEASEALPTFGAAPGVDVETMQRLVSAKSLCSRLEDRELAAQIAGWIAAVHAATEQAAHDALIEQRGPLSEIQERLGTALRGYHQE
ncbi:hypothetical protein [Streptomyces liangshanensis]|uniref:hypothetical protein n=1 Tax=Streptomyces liangshanensis TaxID=2717324 RepID=UPI0036DD1FDD